jgi:Nucleoside 2-deoxyribosyltransferase
MSALIPTNTRSLRLVRSRPVRVYLCGPVKKNCWRHQLVPGLRHEFPADGERARHDVLTELPTISTGFTCNGPWFVGCDHGCMHGRCSHGALGYCFDNGEQDRSIVFRANIERINRADAVFAYIDRAQAYGSAFELGYAGAIGMPIFVGFPPRVSWRDDMWFSAQAGLGSATGHAGAVEVLWKKFCDTIETGLRNTRAIPEENSRVAAPSSLADTDWGPL